MSDGESWLLWAQQRAREQGLDPDDLANATIATDGARGIVRGETSDGRASLDVQNVDTAVAEGDEMNAEEHFLKLWNIYGAWERFGHLRRQVRIIPGRKFASDFVWLRDGFKLLVVEIEGMTGGGGHVGGHRSARGLQRDARKYNLALLNGWGGVYRIPSWWLSNGYRRNTPREFIEEINTLLERRVMLVTALAQSDTDEARQLLALMRYEEDNSGTEA